MHNRLLIDEAEPVVVQCFIEGCRHSFRIETSDLGHGEGSISSIECGNRALIRVKSGTVNDAVWFRRMRLYSFRPALRLLAVHCRIQTTICPEKSEAPIGQVDKTQTGLDTHVHCKTARERLGSHEVYVQVAPKSLEKCALKGW